MRNLLSWTENYFADSNIANARSEAEFLLSGFLGCSKTDLYLNMPGMARRKEKIFCRLAAKRRRGVPQQILLGRIQFMNWTFLIQKGIFIPRWDSELLVEEAYRIIEKYFSRSEPKILDMGTGSGIIAISLAKKFPESRFIAVDKSSRAIRLARRNAGILGVKDRICFRQGNLFSALKKRDYQPGFSLIAANLPYIPTASLPTLPIEVKNFEPRQSLDGGKDGLELYRRLLSRSGRYLKEKGFIVLEIGEGQTEPLRKLVEAGKGFEFIRVIQDYRRLDRIVVLRKN